jgi:hypothetical protein
MNIFERERHVVSSERSRMAGKSTRETPYLESLDESNPRYHAQVVSRLASFDLICGRCAVL